MSVVVCGGVGVGVDGCVGGWVFRAVFVIRCLTANDSVCKDEAIMSACVGMRQLCQRV